MISNDYSYLIMIIIYSYIMDFKWLFLFNNDYHLFIHKGFQMAILI